MWQQVLHKQQQQQAWQVEEGHLHIQLADSKIDTTVYAQAPLEQSKESGFVLLQN